MRASAAPVIEASLSGVAQLFVLAFLFKILATAVTLETGGSGGIVTPLFFIGATSGSAVAHMIGLPSGVFAAFGFVSVLAAAANTPIAAAVMGMELLPAQLGVSCGPLCRHRLSHRGPQERLCEPEAWVLEVSWPRASAGCFDGRSDNRADENPEGQPDRPDAPTDRAPDGQAQGPAVKRASKLRFRRRSPNNCPTASSPIPMSLRMVATASPETERDG